MSDTRADLDAVEARVAAARAGVSTQAHAIKAAARGLVKSPYVIGGLAVGAAATGYVVLKQRGKTARPASRPAGKFNLTSMLKIGQMLLPLLGALGAAAVPKTKASLPVVVPKQAVAQAPEFAPASGNFLQDQWSMAKAAVKAWIDDFAPSMGAALSYYTLFSLAPLLIIVIAVAGLVFGQEAAQGAIVSQMRGIMGDDGGVAVEGMLKAAREPAKGIIATLVGIVTLLIGSTAIFAELQSALDRIWRVPAPKHEGGIWHLLRTRLLSFGLVLGLGFLMIVSLVVSAVLAALGTWWGAWLEGMDVILEILNFVVSFGIFTLLFGMIYKIMPRARIPWRDVWTGAAVTALLFTVGKVLIGIYLGKSSMASAFGAAGSLVVLVVWVYYSAQIFLLGAEYTWVYAHRHGSRALQSPGAAPAVPSRGS